MNIVNKLIIVVFMLVVTKSFAQAYGENRFADDPEIATHDGSSEFGDVENSQLDDDGDGPINPGEVPIDDYLPVLMVVGLGLVGYAAYKKKRLTL